jgi:hypothetical protein
MIQVYIKICDTCGLQYFGQTVQNICEELIEYPNDKYYEGSGVEWRKHNKFHKTHRTKVLFKSHSLIEIKDYCKEFSKSNPNYWESNIFANIIEEDGETNIGSMEAHPKWNSGKSYNELPNFLEKKLLEMKPEYLNKVINYGSKKPRMKEVIVKNTDRVEKIIEDIEMYINRAEKRVLEGKDDCSLISGYREYGPKNLYLLEKMIERI